MLRTRQLAALLMAVMLLLGLLPASSSADVYFPGAYGRPGIGWSPINPLPVTETLLTVAYGNGRWVAVSEHNIYISPDGEQWTRSAPFQSQAMHLVRIIFSGDRFLVTNGVDGLLSPDGETWAQATGLTDLAAGPEGCVAVMKRRLATATGNCEQWDSTGPDEPFDRVSYAGGAFFAAGGYDGRLYRSADGKQWEAVAGRARSAEVAHVAGAAALIMLDDGGVSTSTDGVTWTRLQTPVRDAVGAAPGGDGFLVLSRDGRVTTTADGLRWTEVARLPGPRWFDMAAGADGYVAVGEAGAIARSADGRSWRSVRQGPAFGWTSVAYGAGRFAALGWVANGALLYTSEDGLNWAYQQWLPKTHGVPAVGYMGGQFLVYLTEQWTVGTPHPWVLLTSADGLTWAEAPEPLKHARVISRSGALLAISKDGLLVMAEGRAPETLQLPAALTARAGVVAEDGRILLAGSDGKVAASAGGAGWEVSQVPHNCALGGLAALNGRFVTHCDPGEVFASDDGLAWELIQDVRVYKVDVAGGKFFAVGGDTTAVSKDARTWETYHQQPMLLAFAHGEGRTVGVGQYGLMLASPAAAPETGAFLGAAAAVPDLARSSFTADALESVGQPIIMTVTLVGGDGKPMAGRPVRVAGLAAHEQDMVSVTDEAGRVRFPNYVLPDAGTMSFQAEDLLSGQRVGIVTLAKRACGTRFADVAAADSLCVAVESAAARGLMSGFPDGLFHGRERLTRAQLAKVAALAAGQKPLPDQHLPLSDTAGHWAARDGYLQAAVAAGIMQGDPGGTFRPDDPVTRAELIKVVVALAGITPEASTAADWYTPWVETAYKYRFMGASAWAEVYAESEPLQASQPATRYEAAAMLTNLHRYEASAR